MVGATGSAHHSTEIHGKIISMKKTKLRLHLDAKGMTAAQLAAKIKSSPRNVQAIAQGVRKPSIEIAQKIAKVMGSKIDVLFS